MAVTTVFGLGVEQLLHLGRLPAVLYLPGGAGHHGGSRPRARHCWPPCSGRWSPSSPCPTRTRRFRGRAEPVGTLLYGVAGVGLSLLAGRLAQARGQGQRRRGRRHPAQRGAVGGPRGGRSAGPRRRTAGPRLHDALRGGADRHRHRRGRGLPADVPNRIFADMLGVPPGQNISQTAALAERLPLPSPRPTAPRIPDEELALQRAARTGQPVRAVDVDVVRPDGTRISLLEFAAPLLDDDGRPRGAIGAFLDVSSQRRASEEARFLAEATRLLNDSLDYQDTLAPAGATGRAADGRLLAARRARRPRARWSGSAWRIATQREAASTRYWSMTPAGEGIRGTRGLLNIVRRAGRCCGPTSRARAWSARSSAPIRSSSCSRWA